MRHITAKLYGILDKLLPGCAFLNMAEEVQGALPTEYIVYSLPASRLESMSTLSREYDQLWVHDVAVDIYALTPERAMNLARQVNRRLVHLNEKTGGQQIVMCNPTGMDQGVEDEKDTEGRNVYRVTAMFELWEGTGPEDASSSSSSSPATSSSSSSSSSSSHSASSASTASTASSASSVSSSESTASTASSESSSTPSSLSSSTSSYSSASSSSSSDSGP